MTKFYQTTSRSDKPIKKLVITESLIPEKESITIENVYAKGGKITIKYFDDVFTFNSIVDLINALKKIESRQKK